MELAYLQELVDSETAQHNRRVSAISQRLALAIGCGPEFVNHIAEAALIHDIGKLLVDAGLINKTSSLSPEEREQVQKHTTYAADLLEERWSHVARNIARYHHERWNGTGYPEGLSRDRIPLEAQIVGVADVFDALRSRRSYKRPYTAGESLRRMRYGDDRMPAEGFNPTILAALERVLLEVEAEIYGALAITGAPA